MSKLIQPKGPLAMTAYPKLKPVDEFDVAREHFDGVVAELRSPAALAMQHSELEERVQQGVRELGRRLVQAQLELRAKQEQVPSVVIGSDGVARTHHRVRERGLTTIFGEVEVARTALGARGAASVCPMDAELNLPRESYSHGLRKLCAVEAARGSFDDVVEAVERATGVHVPKRQAEELVARAAVDFEAFYADGARGPPADVTQRHLLCLSLDSKGIVMRPEHLTDETAKKAAASTKKLKRRLSKGEKLGRKRMATVAAVWDAKPLRRQPDDIMRDLRPLRVVKKCRPETLNKRVWTSIERHSTVVTDEVFEEARRRDPDGHRLWIVLVDGDAHQIERVRAAARRHNEHVIIVVDFIHVLEYLWKAAWCFFKEGDAAAEQWVVERARGILEGKSGDVAAGIRRSATLRGLAANKRKGADDCANYLINKREFLRYPTFLDMGAPIATGVIEGACRHLIGDRMDITGARWSLAGAEAVLKIRSLRSSGDFDDYWRFHLMREHERQHLSRYTQPLKEAVG